MSHDYEAELLWMLRVEGLPEPQTQYRFLAKRRFKADFCYPDRKLIIEVDGGTWMDRGGHSYGKGYEDDRERDNLAVLAGWRVLRFTGRMVQDGRAIETIRQALKE